MSARRSLIDRMEQARRENYIDLRVTTPGFEGMYVRCRALTPTELQSSLERDTVGEHAAITSALDSLASTCIAVWEEVDGKGVSPVDGFSGVIDVDSGNQSGDFPTFASPELAEALELKDGSAEGCIRAVLAPHSGLRLMPYADALGDFSTGANESVVRANRGN
ncbi:MAG: hypothetical protein ABIO67_07545 [Mycobacteriales bacterium]